MQSVLFVMAILGCGESDAPCRELGVDQVRYQSEAQCLAASEDVLARRDDLYPSVVAQCRPASARAQLLRGSEVSLPESQATHLFRQRIAQRSPSPTTGS